MALFEIDQRIRLLTVDPRDDLSPDWIGKVGVIYHVYPKSYAFPGVVPDPAQAYEVDFDGFPVNPHRVFEDQIEAE